eukprot:NODE_927_length_3031_cov_0.186562.p3 type:complete len:206 gc:universal NODE_927_length_3031_cov_0.186562:1971-1354(-)
MTLHLTADSTRILDDFPILESRSGLDAFAVDTFVKPEIVLETDKQSEYIKSHFFRRALHDLFTISTNTFLLTIDQVMELMNIKFSKQLKLQEIYCLNDHMEAFEFSCFLVLQELLSGNEIPYKKEDLFECDFEVKENRCIYEETRRAFIELRIAKRKRPKKYVKIANGRTPIMHKCENAKKTKEIKNDSATTDGISTQTFQRINS